MDNKLKIITGIAKKRNRTMSNSGSLKLSKRQVIPKPETHSQSMYNKEILTKKDTNELKGAIIMLTETLTKIKDNDNDSTFLNNINGKKLKASTPEESFTDDKIVIDKTTEDIKKLK